MFLLINNSFICLKNDFVILRVYDCYFSFSCNDEIKHRINRCLLDTFLCVILSPEVQMKCAAEQLH